MFKKVEYVGFDGLPELKAQAEQLTPVLANEIHTWQDDVEAVWSPSGGSAGTSLNLTLSLRIENGVLASVQTTFTQKEISNEGWRMIRCNRAWSNLLGVLIQDLDARVRESLLEPVGV